MKIKGVAHFSIGVSDLERSAAFYHDILGMEELFRHDRMVFLRSAGDHIVLVKTANPVSEASHVNQFRPGIHHAFRVNRTDYEKARKELETLGVTVLGEEVRPTGVFTGRSLYFLDPDGNELELLDSEYKGQRDGP